MDMHDNAGLQSWQYLQEFTQHIPAGANYVRRVDEQYVIVSEFFKNASVALFDLFAYYRYSKILEPFMLVGLNEYVVARVLRVVSNIRLDSAAGHARGETASDFNYTFRLRLPNKRIPKLGVAGFERLIPEMILIAAHVALWKID